MNERRRRQAPLAALPALKNEGEHKGSPSRKRVPPLALGRRQYVNTPRYRGLYTLNSSRRFLDQAASPLPETAGWSLPKLTISIWLALTPRFSRKS